MATAESCERSGANWEPDHWEDALSSFARATGLVLSVYTRSGERALGPVSHQPIGQSLIDTGAFDEGGLATRFERGLVERCVATSLEVEGRFEDALTVRCQPAWQNGELVGVFVYGWVFTRYPDPVLAERVARAARLPANGFWLSSRQHLPTSVEKLSVYARLLQTLTSSVLGQLVFRRALLEADRMKDEFLSTVSHEIRTPLTSVQLRVQTLLRLLGEDADPRVRTALDSMERGLKAQAKLINDLLDTSRVITGKLVLDPKPLCLSATLGLALETAQPFANAKGITLHAAIPEGDLEMLGDPERLQQLAWNLLVNAIKFTPAKGSVWVELHEEPARFTLVVRDDGQGIDPGFMPFLFDRFAQARSQLEASQRGLGLGLPLARHIAELHGGTISARSEGLGHGAVFIVSLPKAPPGVELPALASGAR